MLEMFCSFSFDHGVAVELHVGIGQFRFARSRRKLCLRFSGRSSGAGLIGYFVTHNVLMET